MNRNEKPSLLKGKAIAVGIVICFVAVIAIAGAYTFNNYQKQIDEQVAKAEQQAEELAKESEETTADDIVLPEEKDAVQEDESETETPAEVQTEESDTNTDETAVTGDNTSGVWFSEDSILEWPASGAVIMSYSMDQTVFFQTLEQYKYNPCADSRWRSRRNYRSISGRELLPTLNRLRRQGQTVTLDMGNGLHGSIRASLKKCPFQQEIM